MTQSAASAPPPATVLLVDDEAPIRRSLGPYLERGGYQVMLASDGVEALDLLAAYEVDIVVSDVLMPRMDGRELVRRVRAGGAWTPIILLTQVDASYERVSALDDGVHGILHRLRQIDVLQGQGRRLELRELAQVGQQTAHPPGLRIDDLEVDRNGGGRALGGIGDCGAHSRQGILELMVEAPQELAVLHARLLLNLKAQLPERGILTASTDADHQAHQEYGGQGLADEQGGRDHDVQAQLAHQQVGHNGQHRRNDDSDAPSRDQAGHARQAGHTAAFRPGPVRRRPSSVGPGHVRAPIDADTNLVILAILAILATVAMAAMATS